jgi:hypothetical protein
MFVKIRPVRVYSTIVGCFRKMPVQIFSGMFGVSALLISPVEGSLFKSSLLSYVLSRYIVEKTLQILEETLYHIISQCSRSNLAYGGSKNFQNTAWKKTSLHYLLNHHIQVSFGLLELFLCFQLKQSSHFCFKKEFHIKHNVRSYFEVTRVLLYIYTKNVTPGNKTLGSHLNYLMALMDNHWWIFWGVVCTPKNIFTTSESFPTTEI